MDGSTADITNQKHFIPLRARPQSIEFDNYAVIRVITKSESISGLGNNGFGRLSNFNGVVNIQHIDLTTSKSPLSCTCAHGREQPASLSRVASEPIWPSCRQIVTSSQIAPDIFTIKRSTKKDRYISRRLYLGTDLLAEI